MEVGTSATSIAVNKSQKVDIRDRLQKLIDENDDEIVKNVLIKIRTNRRVQAKRRAQSHTSVTSANDSTKSGSTSATGIIFPSKLPHNINKRKTAKQSCVTSCSYIEQIVDSYVLGACSSRVDEEKINQPGKTLVKIFMIERIRRMEEKHFARRALVVQTDTGMAEAHNKSTARQVTPGQANDLPPKELLGESDCNDWDTTKENSKKIKTAPKPPLIITTTATPTKTPLPQGVDTKIMARAFNSYATPGAERSIVATKSFRPPSLAPEESSLASSVTQSQPVVTEKEDPTMVVARMPSAGIIVKKPSTFMSRFTLGRKASKSYQSSPKTVMESMKEFKRTPKIVSTDEGEQSVEVESMFESEVHLLMQCFENCTPSFASDIGVPSIFSMVATTGVHTENVSNGQHDYDNATPGTSKCHVEAMDDVSMVYHDDGDMDLCCDNFPGIDNAAAKSVNEANNPVTLPIGLDFVSSTRSVQNPIVDSAHENGNLMNSLEDLQCECDPNRRSQSFHNAPTEAIAALGNVTVQPVVELLLALMNEQPTNSLLDRGNSPSTATGRVPTPFFGATVDRSDAVIVLNKPTAIGWVDNQGAGIHESLPECDSRPRWTWRDVVRLRRFPFGPRSFSMDTAENSERLSPGSSPTNSFESYEDSLLSSIWTGTTGSGQTMHDPSSKRGIALQRLEDMLSTETSIDDLWVARKVLKQLAIASGKSVEEVVEDVCDRMDEIDMKFLGGR